MIGIVIVQAGQSFVVAGAFGAGFFMLFSAFTTRKMQNATMRKLMTMVTKLPHARTAPSFLASANAKPVVTLSDSGTIQVGEVEASGQLADDRHNDVFHQRS